MKDPRKEYEAALADFAKPGNRWTAKGRLTYWGKAAGLTADEIVADARAHGVTDRDADIRRGWRDATPQGDRPHGDWRRYAPRAKPPQTFPHYVRDMVAAGGGEATSADLLAMSPLPIPADGRAQTAAFIRSLFDPADVLHVFRDDVPTAGKPGANLMSCREWLAKVERGDMMPGDLIVPNPFTGAEGETTDGKKSRIAQSCLARFTFAVIEFDALSLSLQFAFWRGLLAKSPLAPKVASITYSGGKSLHGLLHVGCRTLADWKNVRGKLRGLLAADPDPAFRADEQAMRPRTGTRLPGVYRFGSGNLQTLLYLNPEAVRPTAATTAAKPNAPTARAEPREAACNRAEPQAGKDAPKTDGRATGRILAAPCDCAPLPPTMPRGDEPLDELLAAMDAVEAWEAARPHPPIGFPGLARPTPTGRGLAFLSRPHKLLFALGDKRRKPRPMGAGQSIRGILLGGGEGKVLSAEAACAHSAEVLRGIRVTLFRQAAPVVDGDEPQISARHEAGRNRKGEIQDGHQNRQEARRRPRQ
jgi:hypothetical protein